MRSFRELTRWCHLRIALKLPTSAHCGSPDSSPLSLAFPLSSHTISPKNNNKNRRIPFSVSRCVQYLLPICICGVSTADECYFQDCSEWIRMNSNLLNECDVGSCVKRKSVDFVVMCQNGRWDTSAVDSLNCMEASSIYVRVSTRWYHLQLQRDFNFKLEFFHFLFK